MSTLVLAGDAVGKTNAMDSILYKTRRLDQDADVGFGSVTNSAEQTIQGAIGAAIGVASTLGVQSLRSWLRRPKIEVLFDDQKTRYHQVTTSKPKTEGGAPGKTLWIRFEVGNKGKTTVDLEAKLTSITNLNSGEEIERFYPVDLQCVSEEGKSNFQLVRGETEVIGLVHKDDAAPESMSVSTETALQSRGRQLTYNGGKYLLTVGLYGAKIDPVMVKFVVENGKEFSNLKVTREK
ncbi:MAG: hypothetical protein KGH57_02160 [Candidatus Micrarchaeota archaeon]|nr:hypothetical protein [Candidatus Micrarchaeota archaeon]